MSIGWAVSVALAGLVGVGIGVCIVVYIVIQAGMLTDQDSDKDDTTTI